MLNGDQLPIVLLHRMAQRGRQMAHSLPQQLEVKSTWEGVGFSIGTTSMVAPLDQVREILSDVTVTRIPGAKGWVRGVSNVRGNLLPILDLQGFLSGSPSKMSRKSRILVIQHKGITAGLVVDAVLGMRHFIADEFSKDISSADASLRDYLNGSYRQGGYYWLVFDIHKLVETPEFLQVAA
jgi:twitching motility protein PilI